MNKQDIETHGAMLECSGCNASKDGKKAASALSLMSQQHRSKLKRSQHKEQKRSIGRTTGEKMSRGPTMVGASQQEVRVSPAAPDPDAKIVTTVKSSPLPVSSDPGAKRRIKMKSSPLVRLATTPASSSSRKASTNIATESRMNIEDDSKSSTPAKSQVTSTDMGTAGNSAVAISTQEGVDGSREKALRIVSVEQTDSRNVMDMSVKGDLII